MRVIDADWPDPCLVAAEGRWYVYATASAGTHIQVAASDDLAHWERLGDALPVLPAWAEAGREWAPKVVQRDDLYLLYFCAHHRDTGQQALAVAWSYCPAGPFLPAASPLLVGFIDPDVFQDTDGALYLLYAGCGATSGAIWGQRLTPDGFALMGEAVRLLEVDRESERGVVEAPTLLVAPSGAYVLLYSVASFESREYAVHWAASLDPLRPFWKPHANELIEGRDGPGHCDVCGDTLVYHRWQGPIGYERGGYRAAHLARLAWDERGRPQVVEV